MENIEVLAQRKSGERSMKKAYSSIAGTTIVLAFDIVWFLIRRQRYAKISWWEIVLLVVSSICFLFSLLSLIFTASNNKFNTKVKDEPLIAFDKAKKAFIVQSFIEMKQLELQKDDVIGVSINGDSDEVTLRYLRNGKEKTVNIGFADSSLELDINSKIANCKVS